MRAIYCPCVAVSLCPWVEDANGNLVDAEGLLVLLFQWTWVFLPYTMPPEDILQIQSPDHLYLHRKFFQGGGVDKKNSELEAYKALVRLMKEKTAIRN